MSESARRLRLALPFTIIAEPDTVHLVAGEEVRYTFRGPQLETWLPDLLRRLDGTLPESEALSALEDERRDAAKAFLERAIQERILVDGPVESVSIGKPGRVVVHGSGCVADALRDDSSDEGSASVHVLAQETLNPEETAEFARIHRVGELPYVWVSVGPLSRGYVSPVFLPRVGPCLECLLRQFEHLSPTPELYGSLREHARRGGEFEPVVVSEHVRSMVVTLTRSKIESLQREPRPASVHRLHVLDVGSLEVQSHPVFVDDRCPHVGEGR